MATIIERFVRDEEGATAIEYALVASLMAIMAIAALKLLGNNMNVMYDEIEGAMSDAHASGS